MKLVEKELSLADAQNLLNNLEKEGIEVTVGISIETTDAVYLGKADEKFKQMTINDIDVDDVEDIDDTDDVTADEEGGIANEY